MATGTVVKFDQVRGYGFVANDAGGDDIFLHVNDLEFDKHLINAGSVVEFEVEDSPRGPKAFGVSLVRRPDAAPSTPRISTAADGDEVLCDFIPASEFSTEVTEALLGSVGSLTGDQLVAVRRAMIKLAEGHGWLGD
ncbi:cold shock domain-containing protein [Actinokineospora sp. PR83]|uniref:cold-shock protein n=1 Tax=Actinokineospora sp. PR83 TaxID=2884908 RepID=UPI0027E04DDF|nr:cold shock domain-containing protein [Actinokineospora sp. PR83]MCG8920399.1 cold shock domain-containing protein [Actinokineospora sp. PR83]